MKKLVLASGSPRRKEILERAGISFVVDAADIHEDMARKLSPAMLVKTLAEEKALAVALRHPDSVVLAADTVVALGSHVWSKPESEKEATMILRRLSGKSHDVWTGFCIIDTKSGKKIVGAEKVRIWFRALSERDIERYVARGESLDAAAGYAFQKNGSILSKRIEGDFSTLLGLPISAVLKALKSFGIVAQ